MLKAQAKEASEGTSKLEADQLSQERIFQDRSEAMEAEECRVEEARLGLEEREKALVVREAELAELEAGREERAAELERVRDRLALLEKGVEGQRADLARRKVRVPWFCVYKGRGLYFMRFVFRRIWYICRGLMVSILNLEGERGSENESRVKQEGLAIGRLCPRRGWRASGPALVRDGLRTIYSGVCSRSLGMLCYRTHAPHSSMRLSRPICSGTLLFSFFPSLFWL